MALRLIINLIFILSAVYIIYLLTPPKVLAANVVLNEIMAKGTDNEWVELFNPTGQTIDLTGWQIKDGNSSSSDDLSLNGTILPSTFVVFEHSKGWLNDSAPETVSLIDNNSQTIDSYIYNMDATLDKTFARVPDGSTNWVSNQDSTKGSANLASLPSPTNSPSLSPTSTPQAPTNTPTPTQTPSSFNISTSTTSITADQNLEIGISLTNIDPTTFYYLKGAFIKSGGSNYFGKTLVNDNFIKNSQSYQDQLPIETNEAGNWSGSLTVSPDSDDSGFSGSGDYILKVGRYTSDGSGPTWSNELTININQALSSTPVSTSHSTPTNLPTSQVLSASTKEATTPQISQSLIPLSLLATTQANLNQKDQDNPLSKTDESNLQVLPFKLNLGIIPGILITLIGIALAGVYFLKKRTT